MRASSRLLAVFSSLVLSCGLAALPPNSAVAQAASPKPAALVPAVMLSDLHFDPFHDPAKVPLLVKAPLDEWEAILKSPDSPTQTADFAALQERCKGKESTDAQFPLLASALQAAKAEAPNAKFVTVSGDLLVHDLDCKYRAAMGLPKVKGDDQSVSAAFAEKTTVFVMKQVEQTFAGIPVYLGLGNNDSRCNHNRLDLHDEYLKATGQAVIDGLVGIGEPERAQALATYQSAGYYGVTMAAPMEKTRLLVVDDIYMMSSYSNCEADPKDQAGAQEQIAWLTRELDSARQKGQRAWVLGHVPPTVDLKGSLAKSFRMCLDQSPDTYLSSDALATALTSHSDVVRLALFGHTHMDELHLLGSKGSEVPLKVVASVSAVDGNTPSFTVSRVSPASSMLVDYSVYTASNKTGIETQWAEEYDFAKTYHEPSFSPKALDDLVGRLRADTAGTAVESLAYQTHFFKGHAPMQLGPLWEGYVCSIDHGTAEGFQNCVCGGR